MWLYEEEPINASYHPAKFDCYSYSGNVVVMVLVCHVISQGNVIKSSHDFVGGSISWLVTTVPNLVAIGIVIVET